MTTWMIMTLPSTAVVSIFIQLFVLVNSKRPPKIEAFFQGRCTSLSPCHQICVDIVGGGFECSCEAGYQLQPNGFACFPSLPEEPDSDDDDADEDETTRDAQHSTSTYGSGFNVTSVTIATPTRPATTISSTSSVVTDYVIQTEQKWSYSDEIDYDNWLRYVAADFPTQTGSTPSSRHTKSVGNLKSSAIDDEDDEVASGGDDNNDDEERVKYSKNRKIKATSRQHVDGKSNRRHAEKLADVDSLSTETGTRHQGTYGVAFSREHRQNPKQHHQKLPSKSHKKNVDDTEGYQGDGGYYDDEDDDSASAMQQSASTCDHLRCPESAQCVLERIDGSEALTPRCRCPLGTAGRKCERDTIIKYPQFSGNGYIAFPVLSGTHRQFKMTVEFRPDSSDGLLLFSADNPDAQFDFFSLSLLNGRMEFRFDCGSGPALMRTPNTVKIGEWNTVTIQRNERSGWITLNDGTQTVGKSKGQFTRINFREDFYLGGYVNVSRISDRTEATGGFVGCVRRLEVNEKIYDMRKSAFVGDAINGFDVEDCSAQVCLSIDCHNGGSCIASSVDTAVCLCPLGFAGPRCENRVEIRVPHFDGTSFLQFVGLGLQRNVLSHTDIEVIIKPTSCDGLIFYNGYSTDRKGDFMSLALKDCYVEYRFDLGTGAAYIRSQPISLNAWHVVKFSRTGREGVLQVDDHPLKKQMSLGAYTQLTLTLDLFIGGHRNFDEVAKEAQVSKSFNGCIQKVVVNKRSMKLLEEASNGINVDNCDHPCSSQPCLNGGRCDADREEYTCSCDLGFVNHNCQDRIMDPITIPSFSGDSYLSYDKVRIRGLKVDIVIWIKARSPNGLLLWVSGDQEVTPYSDYLAVGLRHGFAHFQYNLGSGEVTIVSNFTRIDDNKWHSIHVNRRERSGFIEVDGKGRIEGSSPGSMTDLTTSGTVFIGGMDNIVLGTLHKYSSGFFGCISNVTVTTNVTTIIDVFAKPEGGRNVAQCLTTIADNHHHYHHQHQGTTSGRW